ncbi:hypothetical protein F5Y04DRAFT_240482 [Hypomontagnella monticulosa]|nr:hypothetical protein F5Y04DRAFT_240482 [Hypomontagnella monticulosa]
MEDASLPDSSSDSTWYTGTELNHGSGDLARPSNEIQFLQGPSIQHSGRERQPTNPDTTGLPHAPIHDLDKMVACHGFQASIIDFFIDESEQRIETSSSIYDVLYGKGPTKIMEQTAPPQGFSNSRSFRWYHLPANNLEWVEVLIKRHLAEAGRPAPFLSNEDKFYLELLRPQGTHRSVEAVYSTSKRPGFHTVKRKLHEQTDDSISQFVSFVPFLHFETMNGISMMLDAIKDFYMAPSLPPLASFLRMNPGLERFVYPSTGQDPHDTAARRRSGQTNENDVGDTHRVQPGYPVPSLENLHRHLIRGYLKSESPDRGPPLQMRRTLDRYFYTHLDTTHRRDRDQVVSRFTSRHQIPKLFMVDQLWIWILNGDTIISCLPMQWDRSTSYTAPQTGLFGSEYNSLDVYAAVLKHLHMSQRPAITTVQAMAELIVETCVNIFDPNKLPRDLQFFDFFEASVGTIADRVAMLLTQFRASIMQGAVPGLVMETETLIEVEDMRDELNILRMVLEDQKVVLEDFAKTFDPSSSGQNRVLELHLYRIKKMETVADRTSKMLITLLDLKQKQASIFEALEARKQAESNTQQGRTLMLFTVVTILFLPLSFMAAFFAINIDVFPKDDAGSLKLGYVLEYMLSISAGLSIPFILITFNQRRVWSMLEITSSFIANLPFGFWAIIALGGILQIVNWTAKLSYSIKLAMGITITLLTAVVLCCYYFSYVLSMAAKKETSEPSPWKRLWMTIQGNLQQRVRPSVVGTSQGSI